MICNVNCHYDRTFQVLYFVILQVLLTLSFFFISVGYGLCKPNIAPFGADQMRENGESHLQRFYLWFYFFTNLGAFGAYAVGFMQTQNADAILYFSSFYVSLGFSVICLILLIAGINI